jgi:hypothetical protein
MSANPLLGSSRTAIHATAVAFVGRGAFVIDESCPLTLYPGRCTMVGVGRIAGRPRVYTVRVNVDTLSARAD